MAENSSKWRLNFCLDIRGPRSFSQILSQGSIASFAWHKYDTKQCPIERSSAFWALAEYTKKEEERTSEIGSSRWFKPWTLDPRWLEVTYPNLWVRVTFSPFTIPKKVNNWSFLLGTFLNQETHKPQHSNASMFKFRLRKTKNCWDLGFCITLWALDINVYIYIYTIICYQYSIYQYIMALR